MHPDDPLAKVASIGLRDLASESLAVYSKEDYPEYHLWLENLFRKYSFRPSVCEKHDGSTSLIAAVEAGRRVALVQEEFERLSGPRLHVQPLKPAPPPFVFGVAWREKERDSVICTFLDVL